MVFKSQNQIQLRICNSITRLKWKTQLECDFPLIKWFFVDCSDFLYQTIQDHDKGMHLQSDVIKGSERSQSNIFSYHLFLLIAKQTCYPVMSKRKSADLSDSNKKSHWYSKLLYCKTNVIVKEKALVCHIQIRKVTDTVNMVPLTLVNRVYSVELTFHSCWSLNRRHTQVSCLS